MTTRGIAQKLNSVLGLQLAGTVMKRHSVSLADVAAKYGQYNMIDGSFMTRYPVRLILQPAFLVS